AVDAYSPLSNATKKVTLHHRILADRPLALNPQGIGLVATNPLPPNTVLTERDAVRVLGDIVSSTATQVHFIQVPVSVVKVNQFSLEPGVTITVLFSGQADFNSDPHCRSNKNDGAPSTVEAEDDAAR